MKTLKIFFSETARPRALIFGIYHHQVDLYQVCQIITLGKKWPRHWGHMFYIGLYRETHGNIFLSETIRPRDLIFGMQHHLVDFYQVCSNNALGAKNGLDVVICTKYTNKIC